MVLNPDDKNNYPLIPELQPGYREPQQFDPDEVDRYLDEINNANSGGLQCGSDPWAQAFGREHGRCPNDQDRADRDWSLAFQAQYGRPPSQEDWERHYFQSQGGGGGGEGDDNPWEGTVAELLTNIDQFGMEQSVPVAIQGVLKYMSELMRENSHLGNIPLPEIVRGEPARLWHSDEERAELGQNVTSKFQTLQGLLGFPQRQLGDNVELGDRSAEDQWRLFLSAMRNANVEAAQMLAGLRYNPELANDEKSTSGWTLAPAPQIANAEYL